MVQSDGLLFKTTKKNSNKLKLPRRGKQDSWQAWHGRTRQTGQDRTGYMRWRTGTRLQTQGDYKGSK